MLNKLNDKQVEIITDKYEVYIEKNNDGFTLDYFKANIKDREKAHIDSVGHDEFSTMEDELHELGVSREDVAAIKKLWDLD